MHSSVHSIGTINPSVLSYICWDGCFSACVCFSLDRHFSPIVNVSENVSYAGDFCVGNMTFFFLLCFSCSVIMCIPILIHWLLNVKCSIFILLILTTTLYDHSIVLLPSLRDSHLVITQLSKDLNWHFLGLQFSHYNVTSLTVFWSTFTWMWWWQHWWEIHIQRYIVAGGRQWLMLHSKLVLTVSSNMLQLAS